MKSRKKLTGAVAPMALSTVVLFGGVRGWEVKFIGATRLQDLTKIKEALKADVAKETFPDDAYSIIGSSSGFKERLNAPLDGLHARVGTYTPIGRGNPIATAPTSDENYCLALDKYGVMNVIAAIRVSDQQLINGLEPPPAAKAQDATMVTSDASKKGLAAVVWIDGQQVEPPPVAEERLICPPPSLFDPTKFNKAKLVRCYRQNDELCRKALANRLNKKNADLDGVDMVYSFIGIAEHVGTAGERVAHYCFDGYTDGATIEKGVPYVELDKDCTLSEHGTTNREMTIGQPSDDQCLVPIHMFGGLHRLPHQFIPPSTAELYAMVPALNGACWDENENDQESLLRKAVWTACPTNAQKALRPPAPPPRRGSLLADSLHQSGPASPRERAKSIAAAIVSHTLTGGSPTPPSPSGSPKSGTSRNNARARSPTGSPPHPYGGSPQFAPTQQDLKNAMKKMRKE